MLFSPFQSCDRQMAQSFLHITFDTVWFVTFKRDMRFLSAVTISQSLFSLFYVIYYIFNYSHWFYRCHCSLIKVMCFTPLIVSSYNSSSVELRPIETAFSCYVCLNTIDHKATQRQYETMDISYILFIDSGTADETHFWFISLVSQYMCIGTCLPVAQSLSLSPVSRLYIQYIYKCDTTNYNLILDWKKAA